MLRDESDQSFLATVHRLQPVTVQELCAATGVTATAIRQRLLRLQGTGLLTRGITRGNRGRPFHTYSITDTGLKSLGDDHAELAAILWRQIMKIEAGDVRNQVLDGVKQALVERFRGGVRIEHSSLTERVSQACSQLAEYGFDVEVDQSSTESDLPILKEHNCPYYEVAEEDPGFCEFEQSVFSELIGARVSLSVCRQNGAGHCEFHIGEIPQEHVGT